MNECCIILSLQSLCPSHVQFLIYFLLTLNSVSVSLCVFSIMRSYGATYTEENIFVYVRRIHFFLSPFPRNSYVIPFVWISQQSSCFFRPLTHSCNTWLTLMFQSLLLSLVLPFFFLYQTNPNETKMMTLLSLWYKGQGGSWILKTNNTLCIFSPAFLH